MNIFDQIVMEAELSTKDRDKIDAYQFGLPKERKFPLIDAKDVRSAISYFNACPDDKKPQLAKRIKAAAKKFAVEISPDSPIASY